MDDYQKNPFRYLEATHLNLGLPQMLISEGEKRKSMSRVKIKFERCRDEEQQQQQPDMDKQQQLKNEKMQLKVFQRKLKRRASTLDVTVVQGNTKMNSNDFSSTTCPVCSKFFHSKNALFGHMRAHPDRQWRGIQPPSSPLMDIKVQKNSSSSTVSDYLVVNVDDQIDSASTSGSLGFDVLGSVSKWPRTVKRRRNVAISDHRVLDAIDGLLMLVHGNSMDLVSREFHGQRITEIDHGMYMGLLAKNEELEVIGQVSERSKKKRRIGELEAMNKSEGMNKWKKVEVFHRNDGDLGSGFVPELMKMECGDQMGVIDDNYNKLKPVSNNNSSNGFKCNTCNKSFPSYQALGGHKSKNCRNSTLQTDYHHQYKNISCPNLIKVDQDLKEFNDARLNDVDKHKCKVCDRTFLTGQALGGHQRSHWGSTNGAIQASPISSMTSQMHNVETPSGSVASLEVPSGKTNIKHLDFDLNELATDYDEECLSQLVPPVFDRAYCLGLQ